MGLTWAYAMAATVAGLVVGGGYGFPAKDLVVNLPGQPKVTFNQYAGYVDVGVKTNKKSLFYYFVEAEENPNKKPLTLCLNGGPGCSSVGGGAFTELGPFITNGDGRSLIKNSYSWNKVSNILFVESPVGVGWSYSERNSNHSIGDISTASDMFEFMFNWYQKFPTLRERELFLTGESYAGHYIPQLADRILYHNEQNSAPFNIKGIALGNPLLKVDRDVPGMFEYFWSHGMISDELRDTITNICDFTDYSFSGPDNETQYPCIDAINVASNIVGNYTDLNGVLYDKCYPSMVEQELRLRNNVRARMSFGVDVCKMYETTFYLNLPEVQKALHANRTGLPYSWADCNDRKKLKYNLTDQDIDMEPLLKRILRSKTPLWIYSGDQDSIVPLLGSRTIVRELAHDMNLKVTVPYKAWYDEAVERQVGGWVIEYGNLLTYATVRGAAHMVPYSQPSRALQLFTSFISGRRLPSN